jgi:predicted HTH transcriptional regulator
LRTTQRYLKELSSKGIIVRKGSNKSGYWEITYTDSVK